MTVFAPGFISLPSRSMGGESSIGTVHITAISPTRERVGYDTECTIYLAGGNEVTVYASRDDVLTTISEATGATPPGTGATYQAIWEQLVRNKTALQAAIAEYDPRHPVDE